MGDEVAVFGLAKRPRPLVMIAKLGQGGDHREFKEVTSALCRPEHANRRVFVTA